MNNDLVSIIMPAYNTERFISESIESVLSQTYESWELIICDDSSSDNTKSIARSYSMKDNRINVIDNFFKKGAAGARNSCIDNVNGKYIAFLDSDDLWYPDKIKLQIDYMKEHDVHFVYGYVDIISESNSFLKTYKSPPKVGSRIMMLNNFIPCCTVMYDASKLGKIYQPDIKKRNDYALWLKMLKENVKYAHCIPVVTAKYRSNSYGLASNKIENIKYYYKCRIKYAKSNHIIAVFELISYLAMMIIKTKLTSFYNKLVTRL